MLRLQHTYNNTRQKYVECSPEEPFVVCLSLFVCLFFVFCFFELSVVAGLRIFVYWDAQIFTLFISLLPLMARIVVLTPVLFLIRPFMVSIEILLTFVSHSHYNPLLNLLLPLLARPIVLTAAYPIWTAPARPECGSAEVLVLFR